MSLDDLRIQVCKPRRTGEQKIILYGEGINAKDSNRRVIKFAPSRKNKNSPRMVIQEVSPTARLYFCREPFDLEKRRKIEGGDKHE